MVMGHLYSYEHVLSDSEKYPKITEDGKFIGWWETYLQDAGFQIEYRPFMDLYQLPRFGGRTVGLLMFDIPEIKFSHIVAVDEFGIVDPADGALPHADIAVYILKRISQKAVFHSEFLAIAAPGTELFQ